MRSRSSGRPSGVLICRLRGSSSVNREAGKCLWFTYTQEVLKNAETLAGREMWEFSPVDLAPGIAIPVLMIHGTRDARFPIDEGREVFEAIGKSAPHPADKHLIEATVPGTMTS